jgi:predicted ABC-type transport system involved in lysophospholipase L1 biosynthesis ATPase subunit
MIMENVLFMQAFSLLTELIDHSMIPVPIMIYGSALYRHQTTTARALLNQTQLSQRQDVPNQEHIA